MVHCTSSTTSLALVGPSFYPCQAPHLLHRQPSTVRLDLIRPQQVPAKPKPDLDVFGATQTCVALLWAKAGPLPQK